MNTTTTKKLPYGFVKTKNDKNNPMLPRQHTMGRDFFKSETVNAFVVQNTLSGDWFIMQTINNPRGCVETLVFGSVKHALIYAGETYSINN